MVFPVSRHHPLSVRSPRPRGRRLGKLGWVNLNQNDTEWCKQPVVRYDKVNFTTEVDLTLMRTYAYDCHRRIFLILFPLRVATRWNHPSFGDTRWAGAQGIQGSAGDPVQGVQGHQEAQGPHGTTVRSQGWGRAGRRKTLGFHEGPSDATLGYFTTFEIRNAMFLDILWQSLAWVYGIMCDMDPLVMKLGNCTLHHFVLVHSRDLLLDLPKH